MRIRIIQTPPISSIDGIRLDCFQLGMEYEMGNTVGALFLAEGWAELVPLNAETPIEPFTANDPYDQRVLYPDNPPNLVRDVYPPYVDQQNRRASGHARAADSNRRRKPRRRR